MEDTAETADGPSVDPVQASWCFVGHASEELMEGKTEQDFQNSAFKMKEIQGIRCYWPVGRREKLIQEITAAAEEIQKLEDLYTLYSSLTAVIMTKW